MSRFNFHYAVYLIYLRPLRMCTMGFICTFFVTMTIAAPLWFRCFFLLVFSFFFFFLRNTLFCFLFAFRNALVFYMRIISVLV